MNLLRWLVCSAVVLNLKMSKWLTFIRTLQTDMLLLVLSLIAELNEPALILDSNLALYSVVALSFCPLWLKTTNALKGLFDVHLSVPIERQGWKARFRIAPSSSRFSPTNAHRAGFKSRTRQAETQRFPIIPLHLKSVQNSKRKTSNNIEKSSIRSSKDSYASRRLLLSDWMIVSCQPI